MPKKFQGENSKASAAKARKAEAQAEEKQKKEQALEDAYWEENDKHVTRKLARKEDREKKRQAEVEKKAELRSLVEQETAELALSVTPKATPQKITQYQLERNREMRAEKEKKEGEKDEGPSHLDIPLMENLNRSTDEIISASGVDAALSALSVQEGSSDKHPEKRMAALFKVYEAKRLPQIKKENPSLRLTQQKQLLRKEWQKSPENPINIRNMQ